MRVERPESDDTEDPFPEDTEAVVWAGEEDFSVRNAQEYDEGVFGDDVDLTPVETRHGWEKAPTIVYESGDELPLPVARDIWPIYNDRMAAFDGDGQRLDSPGGRNEDGGAVKQWRTQRVA